MAFLLRRSKKKEPDQIAPTPSKETPADVAKPERLMKVVLVGKDGIGMKPRMQRALRDKTLSEPATTIGIDFVPRTRTIDGVLIKMLIWGSLLLFTAPNKEEEKEHSRHTQLEQIPQAKGNSVITRGRVFVEPKPL